MIAMHKNTRMSLVADYQAATDTCYTTILRVDWVVRQAISITQ